MVEPVFSTEHRYVQDDGHIRHCVFFEFDKSIHPFIFFKLTVQIIKKLKPKRFKQSTVNINITCMTVLRVGCTPWRNWALLSVALHKVTPEDYVKQSLGKCRHLHKDNEMLRPVSWHYVGAFTQRIEPQTVSALEMEKGLSCHVKLEGGKKEKKEA